MRPRPRLGIRCSAAHGDGHEWWRAAEPAGVDWIGLRDATPVLAAAVAVVTNDVRIGWTPTPLVAAPGGGPADPAGQAEESHAALTDGAGAGELARAAAAISDAADGRLDLVLAESTSADALRIALRRLWEGGPVRLDIGPIHLHDAVCAPVPANAPPIWLDCSTNPDRHLTFDATSADGVLVAADDLTPERLGAATVPFGICVPYAAAAADPDLTWHAVQAAATLGAALIVLEADEPPDAATVSRLVEVFTRATAELGLGPNPAPGAVHGSGSPPHEGDRQ